MPASETKTRRNEHRRTARLRKVIERRQRATLWGKVYYVTPRLVTEVFGDGRQLIWLAPLATRPNWYVVRIDSRWKLSNHETGDLLHDHLDDIYNSIEAEFDVSNSGDVDSVTRPWPAFDHSCGCGWGAQDWPRGFIATATGGA